MSAQRMVHSDSACGIGWLTFATSRVVSAALVLCLGALPAQTRAQAAGDLTPMDYIEIQQLVNKLNFALDYCTNNGEDFADLFVAGGQFIIDQGDGMPSVRRTREALIALAGGPTCEALKSPPRSYILHLAESLIIKPTPDGANGMSYAFYPSNKGKYLNDETAGQLGIYYDEYVKTPQGWRFRLRRHATNAAVGDVAL